MSKRPYPYNLIDDLLLGEEFYTELSDDEVKEEVEKLLAALLDRYPRNKHIPQKMQAIIYLRYLEGLTLRETGEAVGVSGGRAGQIRDKALRILRLPMYLNRLLYKADKEAEETE